MNKVIESYIFKVVKGCYKGCFVFFVIKIRLRLVFLWFIYKSYGKYICYELSGYVDIVYWLVVILMLTGE